MRQRPSASRLRLLKGCCDCGGRPFLHLEEAFIWEAADGITCDCLRCLFTLGFRPAPWTFLPPPLRSNCWPPYILIRFWTGVIWIVFAKWLFQFGADGKYSTYSTSFIEWNKSMSKSHIKNIYKLRQHYRIFLFYYVEVRKFKCRTKFIKSLWLMHDFLVQGLESIIWIDSSCLDTRCLLNC